MKGKIALQLFVGVCVVLAILLIAQIITPIIGTVIFAVALVIFGGSSRAFRRK